MINRSKIEWTDYTWNPLTGCKRGCRYCYARRQAQRFCGDIRLNINEGVHHIRDGIYVLEKPFPTRADRHLAFPFGFEPTYHPYRLDDLKVRVAGSKFFVGSMSDMFGPWVPEWIIREIIGATLNYPQHNYLFLTKYPRAYLSLDAQNVLPHKGNYWFGVTVTADADFNDLLFSGVTKSLTTNKFLSVEPLQSDLSDKSLEIMTSFDWIIAGAESGNSRGKVVPERAWINRIVKACQDSGKPLFMKNSLEKRMGAGFIQEYPPGLMTGNTPAAPTRLYQHCAFCGELTRKDQMMTLMARPKRGATAKTVGYLCPACWDEFASKLKSEYGEGGYPDGEICE